MKTEECIFEFRRILWNRVGNALLAFSDIEKYSQSSADRANTRALSSIHLFLIEVDIVRKLLWPSEKKWNEEQRKHIPRTRSEVERRKKLLVGLSIEQYSQLNSQDAKDARNYFEHFDERLETLLFEKGHGPIRDGNLWTSAKPSTITRDEINFDLGTFTLLFGTGKCSLRPVKDALDRLSNDLFLKINEITGHTRQPKIDRAGNDR